MELGEDPDQVLNEHPSSKAGPRIWQRFVPCAGRRRCRLLRYKGRIITSGAQTERPCGARAGRLTSPAGSRQIHGYLVHYAQMVWQDCSHPDFPEVIAPITGRHRVDLRQYRHVLALADHASFRKASEALGISRPR